MQRISIAAWTLLPILAGASMAVAQQRDDGPILRPKPILVVSCDLACNWKLDGQAKGHIAAGGTARVTDEAGAVFQVEATTEDGADSTGRDGRVDAQKIVVDLQLKPIRDARLKTEQGTRDQAARRQQQANQDLVEQSAGLWRDQATGLMWTRKDSGDNNDLNWHEATEYCRNLRLGGYSDWRLPTIDELQAISDPSVSLAVHCCDIHGGWTSTVHVKGNLQLTGAHWSSTSGSAGGQAMYFSFAGAGRRSDPVNESTNFRALCVRNAGE